MEAVMYRNERACTLGTIEFGRYFQDKKLRFDHTKLAIEGKTMLDKLIKQGLPIEQPKYHYYKYAVS